MRLATTLLAGLLLIPPALAAAQAPPGKVTSVDLGATGWPVTGKLAPPPVSEGKLILQPRPDRSLQVRIQRSDISYMRNPADWDHWPAARQHE